MTSFIKETGGTYPLFRVALAVSVVDDLVQMQVSSVIPHDDNWTVMSSCHRDKVKFYEPGGKTEITIGSLTLTYYRGILMDHHTIVPDYRLGEWFEAYDEAVKFLIEMLDIEIPVDEEEVDA